MLQGGMGIYPLVTLPLVTLPLVYSDIIKINHFSNARMRFKKSFNSARYKSIPLFLPLVKTPANSL